MVEVEKDVLIQGKSLKSGKNGSSKSAAIEIIAALFQI